MTRRTSLNKSRLRVVVPHELAKTYRKQQLWSLQESSTLNQPEPNYVAEGMADKSISDISAGFTYFGQLLTHDITYLLRHMNSLRASLELCTLYGVADTPDGIYLRQKQNISIGERPFDAQNPIIEGACFRYREHQQGTNKYYDFIRKDEEALILDERNDDNFIIGQTLLLFMRFHNWVCHFLYENKGHYHDSQQLFMEAKSIVVNCYKWIAVHQYLKLMISDPSLVDQLLASPKAFRIFKSKRPPIVMPEFSDAVLRVGHSQIQSVYRLNKNRQFPIFSNKANEDNLQGRVDRLHNNKITIDWSFLYNLGNNNNQLQKMAAMDFSFSARLKEFMPLPDLVKKDIQRNKYSGYDYALALGIAPLTSADLILLLPHSSDEIPLDIKNLPLGVYVLAEADKFKNGQRLGPLGSQILAEQIIWAAQDLVPPDIELLRALPDAIDDSQAGPINFTMELLAKSNLAI